MSKGKGTGLGILLLFSLLAFGRKVKAAPEKKGFKNMQLSKNFWLGEFLRSKAVPEISSYNPKVWEINNLQRLVDLVLQPLRNKIGYIMFISGGARPASVRTAGGLSFYEALKKAGYGPSKDSDHIYFQGVDFRLQDSKGRSAPEDVWWKAFDELKKNIFVRQVIFYRMKDAKEKLIPAHIHVAVSTENRPRFKGASFAFVHDPK